MDEPFEVAVLTAGDDIRGWVRDAVERLVAETAAEVTLLVVDESSPERPSKGTRLWNALTDGVWGWYRIGRFVYARMGMDEPNEYDRLVSLDDVASFADADRVRCEHIPAEGLGNELPESVVEKLRSVDLGFRVGFGIVTGEALTSPTHGMVSFHHGDMTAYRGRPAGLWEFIHGESEATVTLQRLSEELDGGEVVSTRTVDISDAQTWAEVRDRLYPASVPMLAEGVERLRDPEVTLSTPDALGPLYSDPGTVPATKFVLKNTWGRLGGLVSG